MPFESCVYDEYYYYLLATSWKSNILKYKQDSAGKYLKNQTGGSVTNILVNATDEDIQKCCSSIDENYIFVKEQFDVVEKKTDEKLSNIYDKLVESNEFVKELDKETRYLLQKEIDEKTTDLYNEIANSNEFVKELDKETRYLLEKSTNEKVDLVYEEITRNYKYTEKLVDETKESLSNLKGEIDRNNSYVECLVEISEDKQFQKINEITEIINKKLQDTQTRVLELEKSKEVIFTEEQEKVLNEIVNENIIDVKTELNKETSHRYSELYSYSNEHFSTLYKGLKDTAFNFETILNDKVSNLYQNDENIKWEVNTIKENLTASFALVNTVKELKQELLEQKNNSNQKFIELQKEYEDRLNKQRIKYEKKLMKLEESIKEDKKNPIVKLIEKIKKR